MISLYLNKWLKGDVYFFRFLLTQFKVPYNNKINSLTYSLIFTYYAIKELTCPFKIFHSLGNQSGFVCFAALVPKRWLTLPVILHVKEAVYAFINMFLKNKNTTTICTFFYYFHQQAKLKLESLRLLVICTSVFSQPTKMPAAF